MFYFNDKVVMRNRIVVLVLLFFLIYSKSGIGQDSCGSINKGIDLFNQGKYNESIDIFETVRKSSKAGTPCYIESNLWIAKSLYYGEDADLAKVIKYLHASIFYNSIKALRFYALEYSENNEFITSNINTRNYLNNYSQDEIYFLLANIYARNHEEIAPDLFYNYFITSLKSGYNNEILFSDNYLKKYDEKRYLSILEEYRFSDYFNYSIKKYIEDGINSWQKKWRFETTEYYEKRVNEQTRITKINELAQYYIDSVGRRMFDFSIVNDEYDSEKQLFTITFKNGKEIYLHVPIENNEAPIFHLNLENLKFENPLFTVVNNEYEILHLEVINPLVNKKYTYDSEEYVAYDPSQLGLEFNQMQLPAGKAENKHEDQDFEPVLVTEKTDIISKEDNSSSIQEPVKEMSFAKSDVDIDIPITNYKSNYRFALIIGNEDYSKYQTGLTNEVNVDYAINDAEVFSTYCINILGVPEDNIFLLKNAISTEIKREINKISKMMMYTRGKAEVIFYYAGHGIPNEKTKEAYIVPVDVSSQNIEDGVKLSWIYSKLTEYDSKFVLVFLDACFTGGARNQGLFAARGVKIKPKENIITGNCVSFTSSSDIQSSLPYKEKKHGMFTYFLLKKIKESKGDLTLGELSDYLYENVALNSLRINSKEQTPKTLVSPSIKVDWKDVKLVEAD